MALTLYLFHGLIDLDLRRGLSEDLSSIHLLEGNSHLTLIRLPNPVITQQVMI